MERKNKEYLLKEFTKLKKRKRKLKNLILPVKRPVLKKWEVWFCGETYRIAFPIGYEIFPTEYERLLPEEQKYISAIWESIA